MSKNRHKSKSNHPKPKTLIDGSTYSPNSIGGRIDLQALKDKLFCEELNEINEINETNQTNHNTDEHSEKSLQGKGKAK
jgi:hypothetical protein